MSSVKGLLEGLQADLRDLPVEAYGNKIVSGNGEVLLCGQFDPDDSWLKTADADDQRRIMRSWFLERYYDPQSDLPPNKEHGGYIFLYGGPCSPIEELSERFECVVSDQLIQEIADEMCVAVGDEWAPIHRSQFDDYDDQYDFYLPGSREPLQRLETHLDQFMCVIASPLHQTVKATVVPLVFSAAIGSLEAFLWETAQYWVENDVHVLHDFVTRIPALRDENIKLGDLFVRYDNIKNHVKGHLQNMVWHRWEKVARLYKDGLSITLPNHQFLKDAVYKRHDIVHRSGRDKNGNHTEVTEVETKTLISEILKFANELYELVESHQATSKIGATRA